MGLMDLMKEPAIQLRLASGWRLGQAANGVAFAAGSTQDPRVPLSEHSSAYDKANRRLVEGAPLAALRDCVVRDGGVQLAVSYLVLLQKMCRHGLVEFPLMDEEGETAVLLPSAGDCIPIPDPEAPDAALRLDRFACLRDDGGNWLLESPLCEVRLRLSCLDTLKHSLVRRVLAAAGFLEGGETEQTVERQEALEMWEFHDLLFHSRNRKGWNPDPAGATFQFAGEIDPLPAVRPAWSGKKIELPCASGVPGRNPSLARVLEQRRSERRCSEHPPISLTELGAVLDRCARVRSKWCNEFPVPGGRTVAMELSRRPYPSGGACCALEIYPIVNRCDGLSSGVYHYDAEGHHLVRIAGRAPEVDGMIADANRTTGGEAEPQILLAVTARFGRVMWKYRSIAYGLIMRDTGILYQTLYLVATEFGLSPCALGSGDSRLFARLTGLDPLVEGMVGEFILGGRPLWTDRP